MARTVAPFLLVVLIFFPCAECWEAPWFCHGRECPMYTVVHEYEERIYDTTHWITTGIASTDRDDISEGFWKLYYFNQGENKEQREIPMTRPVVVSVKEADSIGERQVSISVFQSDTNIPDPNDESIRKIVIPGGTVYVRSFGGIASDADALDNAQRLKADLKAAGKQFDENKFDAAGYDAPWDLINRHNEVWIHAL